MMEWIVTSSVLILLVLALRGLLRDKISLRLRYALWLVVAVRLLAPFQPFTAPASAGQAAAGLSDRLEQADFYAFPTGKVDLPRQDVEAMLEDMGPDAVISTDSTDRTFHLRDQEFTVQYYTGCSVLGEDGVTNYALYGRVGQLLTGLWAAGAAVFLAVLLLSNLRFGKKLRARRRPLAVDGVSVPVYVAEGLPSPCLFGLFRPSVYLTPQAAEDEGVRAHVLAHELTHHAHFDHIWAAVRALCLVLHWYNPLVWLAAWLSKGDGELACDEGAVARLGEEQRIPYGRTLVGLVAARGSRPADLLSCSTAMTGGKKTIQQRVALLVKKPETKKAALFAALALLALAVVVTFSKGSGSGCGQFLDQVKEAQVVSIHQFLASNEYVPYHQISDPDLLAKAKKLLTRAKESRKIPENVDWVIEDLRSPFLRLGDWADGDSLRYSLYKSSLDGADVTYVLMRTDNGEEPFSCTPVALLDGTVEEQLWTLAREQYERDKEKAGRDEIRDPGDVAAALQPEDISSGTLYLGGDYDQELDGDDVKALAELLPQALGEQLTRAYDVDSHGLECVALRVGENVLNLSAGKEEDIVFLHCGDGVAEGEGIFISSPELHQLLDQYREDARYYLDDPEAVTAVLELLAEDQEFLKKNDQMTDRTEEEITRFLMGEGGVPAPEVLNISYAIPPELEPGWMMTTWGDESGFQYFWLPAETMEQVREIVSFQGPNI